MTTIDKHEYFKMIRAREERIRTFMQLELEACLEEVSWMLRCQNCEALDCPQEEYPARLLLTPPPSYIDNLQSRLIRARKGIFPASLKMILKTEYQPSVLRPVPKTSVQPDGMIGEHRAGENSTSSECDSSPRLIRGQRNPDRRRSRPRSVRGHPKHREQKCKWRKKFSRLKPVWIVFCVQIKISQARSRSLRCFISKTSG